MVVRGHYSSISEVPKTVTVGKMRFKLRYFERAPKTSHELDVISKEFRDQGLVCFFSGATIEGRDPSHLIAVYVRKSTKNRQEKRSAKVYPYTGPKLAAPPAGMVEMFTTPRKNEAEIVKSILRKNGIKHRSREEHREIGRRYCIYVPSRSSDKAYRLIDDGLSELNMKRGRK